MRIHTDPFYLNIQRNIEEHGRMVLAVGPEGKKSPPFAYTIGNHEHALPELLLIGPFAPEATCKALNMLSARMIEAGAPFGNGELVNIGGEFSMQLWDATAVAKLQYTLQATEYFGHKDYTVQQVVLPDTKGRFPGNRMVSRKYKVPVLRATAEIMQSLRLH
jgi:hypothetical protein